MMKRSWVQSPAQTWDFFSSGELFHGMYELAVCVFKSFVHVLSYVVFGGGPCTLLTFFSFITATYNATRKVYKKEKVIQ